ncbi:hypothetical protein ABZ897_19930 [Nonomuraea sp. NPDC046802]|uniref:hypothetical protein n=1 Tax=Nonomuraea sp. NPDC046802 TaxID=3154919 RepID=UPI0033DCAECD
MNDGPYTYITLSMQPDEPTHVDVSFYTSGLQARSSVINERRPSLSIISRDAKVAVSTTGGGPVTNADLAIAREIFTAAAQYLADCERLHAEHDQTAA